MKLNINKIISIILFLFFIFISHKIWTEQRNTIIGKYHDFIVFKDTLKNNLDKLPNNK